MKAKLILFLAILLLTCAKTYAGWYNTYTYSGSIGTYPVTLALQLKEGYFGEAAKKGYNVIGMYRYGKYNTPIRLEGTFDRSTNKIKIYEYGNNGKVSATFLLGFTAQILTGTWINNKDSLKVSLQLVSRLSDLADEEFDNVEIPQFPSLANYFFVGVYAKKSNSTEAHMHTLKIISKKTGRTIQTLNFDNIQTPTGNLMTIIFDNVITVKGNGFMVSNKIGRVGGYLTVDYDPKTKRFTLNPEPVAEGINGNG